MFVQFTLSYLFPITGSTCYIVFLFACFQANVSFGGIRYLFGLLFAFTFWTRGLIYFMNTGKFSPLTLQIWLLPILYFTFLNLRSFYYASYILFVCSWDLRFWIILQSMFLYFYLDIFFRPIFSITNSLSVTYINNPIS